MATNVEDIFDKKITVIKMVKRRLSTKECMRSAWCVALKKLNTKTLKNSKCLWDFYRNRKWIYISKTKALFLYLQFNFQSEFLLPDSTRLFSSYWDMCIVCPYVFKKIHLKFFLTSLVSQQSWGYISSVLAVDPLNINPLKITPLALMTVFQFSLFFYTGFLRSLILTSYFNER